MGFPSNFPASIQTGKSEYDFQTGNSSLAGFISDAFPGSGRVSRLRRVSRFFYLPKILASCATYRGTLMKRQLSLSFRKGCFRPLPIWSPSRSFSVSHQLSGTRWWLSNEEIWEVWFVHIHIYNFLNMFSLKETRTFRQRQKTKR